MFSKLRKHLGVKFFLSYFVVFSMGILVLISASQFTVPNAFERHMAEMTKIMGDQAAQLETDLFVNFQNAFSETLIFSAAAAFISALLASIFVTRQVVAPIRRLQQASQHIADGHYDERVPVLDHLPRNELDELEQLAVSFNQMTQRLEQAEGLRRQLIGDIAHELRTPLSTIKGSLEGLIDGVLPAKRDTYHQIYQEAERLQLLVDDLQDLNRVESGAFPLEIQPIDPAEVANLTVDRLARQFQEKGVSLVNDLPKSLPIVNADRDRLVQVFTNLIGNALQYTPEGGEVQVSAQRDGRKVLFQVVDNGIGISADDLPHIFTRFYRVDKSRSRAGGGSGIGLTIAKYLVESQGGRISASSPGLGQGSTFTVELPAA